MSKQSDAKATQNYSEKPFVKMCVNCVHFRFDRVFSHRDYERTEHFIDKNLRCKIGEFLVKKTALCDHWK